ncbi:MAG TPA: TIGR03667 family PPOX class F420-dependent oxidoreductase [Candidatus Dormibacteraeota bacterium]|nr:TIGR03667 family PPOX class F420-dependent oxidoreductase [Candidatus Dormibacteraeota bacterium]
MPARKPALLDTSTTRGKHVQRRLQKEIIIWLATGGAEGRPHAVPVWFWWDGDSFLIYSLPGQKVRDIEANPKVALHFNATSEGGDVVRIDGTAARLRRHPPADKVPDYVRKYAALIKGYHWTPESFAKDYNVVLRIRPTRFRA